MMARRNQYLGERRERWVVIMLAVLGTAAIVLLVVGLVLANGSPQ